MKKYESDLRVTYQRNRSAKTKAENFRPFEVMAKRGRDTLLFGPMKPVGLEKPGDPD